MAWVFCSGIKAFTAAVFFGDLAIWCVAGAVVGGILLGLIEAIASGSIVT